MIGTTPALLVRDAGVHSHVNPLGVAAATSNASSVLRVDRSTSVHVPPSVRQGVQWFRQVASRRERRVIRHRSTKSRRGQRHLDLVLPCRGFRRVCRSVRLVESPIGLRRGARASGRDPPPPHKSSRPNTGQGMGVLALPAGGAIRSIKRPCPQEPPGCGRPTRKSFPTNSPSRCRPVRYAWGVRRWL